MPDDISITSVFDYAKSPPRKDRDIPSPPTVYATYVEHVPNSHPKSSAGSADLVVYANGALTLSADKKTLTGELKLWRNFYQPSSPLDGQPAAEDVFVDMHDNLTVAISVTDGGQATYLKNLKGHPIGGFGPTALDAKFDNAIFIENSAYGMRSLSFTLGI
jgi:hypothetical protein